MLQVDKTSEDELRFDLAHNSVVIDTQAQIIRREPPSVGVRTSDDLLNGCSAAADAPLSAGTTTTSTSKSEEKRGGRGGTESCTPYMPEILTRSMWSEPPADTFFVRGKTYLTDGGNKIPSAPSALRLLTLDIIKVDRPILKSICAHPKERLQQALAAELEVGQKSGMPPFVFCVNITLPPHHHVVAYYAVDDLSIIDGTDKSPSSILMNKFFFGDSDKFRDETFKLVPRVVDGNFVVKKAVGSTPCIMGTKLKQHYFRGDRYFEILLDVGSSSVAKKVVKLCLGYARSIVVDLAFLFEGKEESTLPERILGTYRLNKVDFRTPLRFVEQY